MMKGTQNYKPFALILRLIIIVLHQSIVYSDVSFVWKLNSYTHYDVLTISCSQWDLKVKLVSLNKASFCMSLYEKGFLDF